MPAPKERVRRLRGNKLTRDIKEMILHRVAVGLERRDFVAHCFR